MSIFEETPVMSVSEETLFSEFSEEELAAVVISDADANRIINLALSSMPNEQVAGIGRAMKYRVAKANRKANAVRAARINAGYQMATMRRENGERIFQATIQDTGLDRAPKEELDALRIELENQCIMTNMVQRNRAQGYQAKSFFGKILQSGLNNVKNVQLQTTADIISCK